MSCIFADFDAMRKSLDKGTLLYHPIIFPQLDHSGTSFLLEPNSLKGQYLKLMLYPSKGYKKSLNIPFMMSIIVATS